LKETKLLKKMQGWTLKSRNRLTKRSVFSITFHIWKPYVSLTLMCLNILLYYYYTLLLITKKNYMLHVL
jgi:hypothetical protein